MGMSPCACGSGYDAVVGGVCSIMHESPFSAPPRSFFPFPVLPYISLGLLGLNGLLLTRVNMAVSLGGRRPTGL